MWEEHPEYQKLQAKTIGVGLVLLFLGCIVYSISREDWQMLRLVLFIGVAFVISVALLSGTAWAVVRVLTQKRRSKDNS